MKLLIDTQVMLWSFFDHARLGSRQRQLIQENAGRCWVSIASPWETEIKRALGKLNAPDDVAGAIALFGWQLLPIRIEHTRAIGRLPHIHGDPFDRMLVAQAQT